MRTRTTIAALALPLTLVIAGCGGDDSSEATDPATASSAASSSSSSASSSAAAAPDAAGGSDPAATETAQTETSPAAPADPGPALPTGAFCDRLDLSGQAGKGEAVDVAPGDTFPDGLGEAINQTCFQRGAKGAMEVILHSDPTEGQKVYDRVQAGQVPLSDCNKPDLFGSRYLADTVAAACEPAQSSAPIPATVSLVSPVGDGFMECIAARPLGEKQLTVAFIKAGAAACGRAITAATGS